MIYSFALLKPIKLTEIKSNCHRLLSYPHWCLLHTITVDTPWHLTLFSRILIGIAKMDQARAPLGTRARSFYPWSLSLPPERTPVHLSCPNMLRGDCV